MDVLQPWKALKDRRELFAECFLGVFDFTCIEAFTNILSESQSRALRCDHRHTPYPADLEPCSDLCGKTTLRATQDNVKKLLTCRYRLNLFPSCFHGGNGKNVARFTLVV